MTSRARLATWGLVALLAVDVALISLAFRNPFRQPLASTVSVTTDAASTHSSPPSAPPTTTATAPPPAETSAPARGPLGIVAVDASSAWKFRQGACPAGGSKLWHSANGGRTWDEIAIPFSVISRVQVTDSTKILVVGSESTWRESALHSSDTGKTWSPGGALSLWYPSLATPKDVVNSAGRVSTPCGETDAVSVSSLSATSAAVLCGTGKVMETANAGSTWVAIARNLKAAALAVRLEAGKLAAIVAHPGDGCSGAQLSVVVGTTVRKIGCVDLGGRESAGLIGEAALGIEGDAGWFVLDDATYRSDDGGKTWAAA